MADVVIIDITEIAEIVTVVISVMAVEGVEKPHSITFMCWPSSGDITSHTVHEITGGVVSVVSIGTNLCNLCIFIWRTNVDGNPYVGLESDERLMFAQFTGSWFLTKGWWWCGGDYITLR